MEKDGLRNSAAVWAKSSKWNKTYNPTLPYRNRTTPEVIIQLLPVFKMIRCMLPNLSSLPPSLPPQPPSLMNNYYMVRATWAYGTLVFVAGFRIKNCWMFPDRRGARGNAVGWSTALQVGRSRVWFPMVSLEFFIDIILPTAVWLWGWLNL